MAYKYTLNTRNQFYSWKAMFVFVFVAFIFLNCWTHCCSTVYSYVQSLWLNLWKAHKVPKYRLYLQFFWNSSFLIVPAWCTGRQTNIFFFFVGSRVVGDACLIFIKQFYSELVIKIGIEEKKIVFVSLCATINIIVFENDNQKTFFKRFMCDISRGYEMSYIQRIAVL